eukprot:gene726-899_t
MVLLIAYMNMACNHGTTPAPLRPKIENAPHLLAKRTQQNTSAQQKDTKPTTTSQQTLASKVSTTQATNIWSEDQDTIQLDKNEELTDLENFTSPGHGKDPTNTDNLQRIILYKEVPTKLENNHPDRDFKTDHPMAKEKKVTEEKAHLEPIQALGEVDQPYTASLEIAEKLANLADNTTSHTTIVQQTLEQIHTPPTQKKAGEKHPIKLKFLYGHQIPNNYNKAFKHFKTAAKHGDSMAQYNIGLMYLHGVGAPEKDAKKAMKWLKKAAQKKDIDAQYLIGWMYLHGHGVPQKDYKTASEWLSKAARNGHVLANEQLKSFKKP